jgi:hypothetical protein
MRRRRIPSRRCEVLVSADGRESWVEVEVDPNRGTTWPGLLVGFFGRSVLLMIKLRFAVAAVVAVGMWATL